MAARLKLYMPPEEETEERPDPDICIRLGDLLPLAAMAQRMNFIWLKDFLDDEVKISQDFYDVMQAFQSSRPTSA
jgi:hypothetical protein